MGSIVRLNEDNLILMVQIQWSGLIYLNRDMEHSGVRFHDGIQGGAATIRLSDELRASEAKLRSCSAWHEHGTVVDRDENRLFDWTGIFVPKGCGWDGVAQQGRILVKPSK